MAYRIGFDFVDLKQCHRYLLNELLAARTRPGKYGGSFENRTRWILRARGTHPGRESRQAHRNSPERPSTAFLISRARTDGESPVALHGVR